jgi:hypothetical protein
VVDSSSSIVDCALCDDVNLRSIYLHSIVSTLLITTIMYISIYMCYECVFSVMMMMMMMMMMTIVCREGLGAIDLWPP